MHKTKRNRAAGDSDSAVKAVDRAAKGDDDVAQEVSRRLLEKGIPPEKWAQLAGGYARNVRRETARQNQKMKISSMVPDNMLIANGEPEARFHARKQLRDPHREYARRKFETSTRVRWTSTIEKTFGGWIGTPQGWASGHQKWNAQTKVPRNLAKQIRAACKWCDRNQGSGLETTLKRLVEELPTLDFFSKRRKFSRDVTMLRFLDVSHFLRLGRRPTLDELTCVSILLGHDVKPRNTETPPGFFRRHKKRIRKLQNDHPKVPKRESEVRARKRDHDYIRMLIRTSGDDREWLLHRIRELRAERFDDYDPWPETEPVETELD